MRCILYGRVSTDEQASKGYSLGEQMRELREYAQEQGYEVLKEVEDRGFSRSTLNRPGITRVREMVAAGGVDLVLAWKRDRFGHSPWPETLSLEFEAFDCGLRSLDDSGEGDDAEFLGGIKDLIAKRELKDTVRRVQAGKAGKVRSGRVLGSGPAPLGFTYVRDESGTRVGLEVHEPEISVVRRLFELVGGRGYPMYRAGRELERSGHTAPGGGSWMVGTINRILTNEVYHPHTYEEVAALVSPEVSSSLEPEQSYGIYFYGKRRVKGPASGPRTYRKVPREQWLAVPVPDAGIPRGWADAARQSIEANPTPNFHREDVRTRQHELNGGVAVCGECGRALSTSSSVMKSGKYWYYSCPGARLRGGEIRTRRCSHKQMHPASQLEEAVAGYVDTELLTDAETLEAHLEEAISAERGRITPRGDAAWADSLAAKIAEVDAERERIVGLYARGGLSDEEFDRHAATIAERKKAAKQGLAEIQGATSRITEMERAKRAVLEMFGTGLMIGIRLFPPRIRRAVYGLLGLRVEVHPDRTLTIEGRFDARVLHVSPEVEQWVEGMREIDRRIAENPSATDAEAIDRIEAELAALQRRFRDGEATSGCG